MDTTEGRAEQSALDGVADLPARFAVALARGDNKKSPLINAIDWFAPWNSHLRYPGRRRVAMAILDRDLSWSAVQNWYRGRQPIPAWAAERFAAAIRAKAMFGLTVADELDRAAADHRNRVRRLYGVCAIQADGRSKRGMGARGASSKSESVCAREP